MDKPKASKKQVSFDPNAVDKKMHSSEKWSRAPVDNIDEDSIQESI